MSHMIGRHAMPKAATADPSTPRRVALVCPEWPPGSKANGIVSYTSDIRDGMRQLGADVWVITRSLSGEVSDPDVCLAPRPDIHPSALQRRLARLRIRLHGEGSQRRIDAQAVAKVIRRLTRRHGLQLVESEESGGLAAYFAATSPVPIVLRLHGPWFINGVVLGLPEDEVFHRRVDDEGRAIAAVAGLTVPTRNLLDRVRRHYGLALDNAAVIPNPIRQIEPAQRWSLNHADAKRILFIGRIDRLKGADLVIRAFANLAAADPQFTLVLVGPDRGLTDDDGRTWSYEEYLRRHVPADVRPRINWLGQQPRDQLDELRRRSLVTVVASRYENFPYTALEAMAMGCPLVTASVGGLSEIIQDNRNGLAFTAGDEQHLAAQLRVLLEHPARTAELGRQAAADAFQRYRPEAVARQTLDYYAKTIESAHGRGSPVIPHEHHC